MNFFHYENGTMRSQRHAFAYKSAKWRVSGPQRKLEESGLVSRVRLCTPGEIQLVRGPRVNRRVMSSTMPSTKQFRGTIERRTSFQRVCIDLPAVGLWLWDYSCIKPHLARFAMRSTPSSSTRKLVDSPTTPDIILRIITEQEVYISATILARVNCIIFYDAD